MRKYTTTISVNKKVASTTESSYSTGGTKDLKNLLERILSAKAQSSGGWNWPEGEKLSVDFNVVIECTMNRRAPNRPPAVIAAEKKARADARREWEAQQKLAEQERKRIAKQRQQRIKNQIDFAFKSGSESGTEPVSKFVTCQQCDGPADVLELNQEVPFGASVLDESTIVGAVCAAHDYSKHPYYANYYGGRGIAQSFPVAKLEFFYTGVRQIGIKR